MSPRPILLLDEPTSELDGESSRAVCSILARLSGKHTIIVATHDEQVRGICDRVFSVEGDALVEIAGAKKRPRCSVCHPRYLFHLTDGYPTHSIYE